MPEPDPTEPPDEDVEEFDEGELPASEEEVVIGGEDDNFLDEADLPILSAYAAIIPPRAWRALPP